MPGSFLTRTGALTVPDFHFETSVSRASAGTSTLGPFQVGDDIRSARLEITRWSSATVQVTAEFEVSDDNRQTWRFFGSFSDTGGPAFIRRRNPDTGVLEMVEVFTTYVFLSIPSGVGREVRIRLVVEGGGVTIPVVIDLLTREDGV